MSTLGATFLANRRLPVRKRVLRTCIRNIQVQDGVCPVDVGGEHCISLGDLSQASEAKCSSRELET